MSIESFFICSSDYFCRNLAIFFGKYHPKCVKPPNKTIFRGRL